jgi:hypothetical protein
MYDRGHIRLYYRHGWHLDATRHRTRRLRAPGTFSRTERVQILSVEPRSPHVTVWPPYVGQVSDDPRLAQMRDDVAARLSRACAHLPPQAFETLVRDICMMKLRWDPHAADRLPQQQE